MSNILYIVMPTYNEEDIIETVIDQWYPILENGGKDSKLIIADNGSTDKTHLLLKKLQKTHHKIEILEDTDKQHGPKLMALYKYASDHGADWIFQTDSDG